MLMAPEAVPFWLMFMDDGLAARAKSGVTTVSLMGRAEVTLPPDPITVTVAVVPEATVLAAVKVIVVVAPVTTLELGVAVMPVGNPATVNVTGLVKPFTGLMAMVLATLPPASMLMLSGLAARVNVGLPEGGPWKVVKTVSAGLVRGLYVRSLAGGGGTGQSHQKIPFIQEFSGGHTV